MPDDVTASDELFDFETLEQLIELMERHDLQEVSLRSGDKQWRLRRGPPGVAPPAVSGQASPSGVEIKSPTVGTFYAAPSPDDEPFVSVGSRVQFDTIVCIVEAMKVFNQIPAEVSGTITEVLVGNGDPVEFGQPLFRVRPD